MTVCVCERERAYRCMCERESFSNLMYEKKHRIIIKAYCYNFALYISLNFIFVVVKLLSVLDTAVWKCRN